MLKGVIFDMDGTITLTEPLHHRAFAAIFQKFGITYTLDEQIKKYAGSGSAHIFAEVFARNSIKADENLIKKCIDAKRELYTKIVQESKIEVVAGVQEFVRHVDAQGLKKIIATGNSNLDIVRYILKKIGLLEFFPSMLSITEVPRGKPFPDVFLEASRRMGVVTTECLVLEDALNGVSAAHAAGIRCIALETTTPGDELRHAGASSVVKDYYQITDAMLYG